MTVSEPAGTERGSDGSDRPSDRPALPPGLLDLATATGGEDPLPVEEPATGTRLAEIPACGEGAVELAVERARDAQRAWSAVPPDERAEVVERFHGLLLDRRSELLDIVQLETGKARQHAYQEVLSAAGTARHYAVRAEGYLEPERRKGALPGLTRTEVFHDPKGVVGQISPWNYPFELVVSDAIPALLAGNAVVCKPAADHVLRALRPGAPPRGRPPRGPLPGRPRARPGGRPPAGRAGRPRRVHRLDRDRPDGRGAGRRAPHLLLARTRGKNPAIVRADADLDRAVDGLVRGCFDNAGQTCIAIERVYVDESVYDEFLEGSSPRRRPWSRPRPTTGARGSVRSSRPTSWSGSSPTSRTRGPRARRSTAEDEHARTWARTSTSRPCSPTSRRT